MFQSLRCGNCTIGLDVSTIILPATSINSDYLKSISYLAFQAGIGESELSTFLSEVCNLYVLKATLSVGTRSSDERVTYRFLDSLQDLLEHPFDAGLEGSLPSRAHWMGGHGSFEDERSVDLEVLYVGKSV